MTEGRRRGREPADAVRDSTRLEVLLVGPLDPIPTAQHLYTFFYAVSSPGRHGPQNFRRKAACLLAVPSCGSVLAAGLVGRGRMLCAYTSRDMTYSGVLRVRCSVWGRFCVVVVGRGAAKGQ